MIIVLLILVVVVQSRVVQKQQDNELVNLKHNKDGFKITVPGAGIIDMTPSSCTVIFAIEIWDKDASTALDKANNLVTSAVNHIEMYLSGMDYEIQTGIFQLSLRYDYSSGSQQFVGYTVTNQLYITTKDLKIIGKIITVGVQAGLNRIDGVNYSNNENELKKANDQAIEVAIKDAERKAKKIAESLGMKVSKILKFKYLDSYGSSVTNGYTPPGAGAEAYDAKAKAPTPVFASKTHVRVDIELKVLLE